MAEHSVVLKTADGGVEFHPMKRWLRENSEYLPEGRYPPGVTSHQLRAALRRQGWRLEVLSDRVLVIKPDEDGDTSYADDLWAAASGEGHEDEIEDDADEIEDVIEAEKITFGLERDLQSALRANIEQLEPGLKIIDGGKERVTEAGRIDITATDSNGAIVVIELKAGTAAPESVAQILAYMGTVAEGENRAVRGILVAGDFHKRVVFASRAISNLALRKYRFQFRFDTMT